MGIPISKQIKRFIFRLSLITIILLFFDLGIGTLLKLYYYREKSGQSFSTTYAIDSVNTDILIFGSSRAIHHYIPKVFQDSLGLSVFNIGRDGSFLLYNYAVFKAISKRYHPKLIIFDITPEEITRETTSYDRLSVLLPYYQDHPEIRATINLRGPFEMIKRISSIYPYNSAILSIIKGNISHFNTKNSEMKGYIPISKIIKNKKIGTLDIGKLKNETNTDKNKIAAIKNMIEVCKKSGIKIIFVQSPMYIRKLDYYFNPQFSKLCSDNEVQYFNLSNHFFFLEHPEFFADKNHLNNEGAILFSKLLITKIKLTI
ncbi:MAG: hypothetical protein WCK09_01310 [Bacteroidota bacterium]